MNLKLLLQIPGGTGEGLPSEVFMILALMGLAWILFLLVWPLAIYALGSQILKEVRGLRSEMEEARMMQAREARGIKTLR